VVFRQGDPSDGLYIVVNGRLCFRATTPDGQETASGEVKVGETVGEFSLLTGEARSATVYATRETTVARMTPAIFERLVRRHPELAVNITRVVVKRQQEALTRTKPVALATLALTVLPAGPQVDARQFAQELGNALARFGSTLAIDGEGFDRRYGQAGAAQSDPGDPRHPAIVAWMDELEAATNYLIFVADSNSSP
jgi:signal-transduction protein with cAMP-binding, CBS, and nucleotidyltransferase domain